MTQAEVLVEVLDGVVVATLNRPEVRNAVNRSMAEQIAAAMELLEKDPELRVGILTGADGAFCAGMDLKAFVAGENAYIRGRGFAGIAKRPPKKPLIAAVEGHALAGGLEIALACDLIVASRSARFGLPETRRGLVAASGGLLRLPERLPYQVAMELVLTGGSLEAERAYHLGLVNRLTEPGEALATAKQLAADIAQNAPLATVAAKRIIVESADWSRAEAFAKQDEIAGPVLQSKDAVEGARAFNERRRPIWRGE
ncbi:crotonase/enoyl-CoA hydratase family protein [Streptomyces sp. NPDC002577]